MLLTCRTHGTCAQFSRCLKLRWWDTSTGWTAKGVFHVSETLCELYILLYYIFQPHVMPCHLTLISLYPLIRTAILPQVVKGVLRSLSHGSPLFGAPHHNNAISQLKWTAVNVHSVNVHSPTPWATGGRSLMVVVVFALCLCHIVCPQLHRSVYFPSVYFIFAYGLVSSALSCPATCSL